ncbi:hypothetical protein IMSHALPRED_009430 [Imshaugia aleurites]|uniref:Uncharacterized protein n=1 Tax=Imshaugia aleurites TaxID=172621 RepID=A0A8H3IU40_9LECA|nr:hypothetical protein IMSHALPRED_009430 [Imshaugia aleurites]
MHKTLPAAIILLIAAKALSIPAPIEASTPTPAHARSLNAAHNSTPTSSSASPVHNNQDPPVAAGRGGGYNGTPLPPAMGKRQLSSPPTAAGRGGYNGVGVPTSTPLPPAMRKREMGGHGGVARRPWARMEERQQEVELVEERSG